MKRDLSCIVAITRYLAGCKGNPRRFHLIRGYLRMKLEKLVTRRVSRGAVVKVISSNPHRG